MKRKWVIWLIVCGCIAAIVGAVSLFMHSSTLQTLVAEKAIQPLNERLGTNLQVGHVRLQFPLRVTLQDVYLPDENGDSLAYIGRLYVHLSPMSLKNKGLHFHNIEIDRLRVDAHPLSDSSYNYTFFVEALSALPKDTSSSGWIHDVQIRRLCLNDIHVRYDSLLVDLSSSELSLPRLDSCAVEALIQHAKGEVRNLDGATSLQVDEMQIHLCYSDTAITLPQLRIQLPHSIVDASGVYLRYPHNTDELPLKDYFLQNYKDIYARLHLQEAHILPCDFQWLIPALKDMDDMFSFRADLSGTLDSVSAQDLALLKDNELIFSGNCSAIGLPNLDSTYLHAQCQDLSLRPHQVEQVVSDLIHRPFHLPQVIRRLGHIHYRGVAKGRVNNFSLRGAFTSPLGTITTDGTCVADSSFESCVITGRIGTKRFRLGTMLANKDFGVITTTLDTKMRLSTSDSPSGEVNVLMDEFVYKDYSYSQLQLSGTLNNLSGALTMSIADSLLGVDLSSTFCLRPDTIRSAVMQARVHHAFPDALNWSNRYSDSEVRTMIDIAESLDSLNHLIGHVYLDSTYLRVGDSALCVPHVELTSEATHTYQHIKVDGDVLTGHLSGDFDVSQLWISLQKQAAHYLPSLFTAERVAELNKKHPTNRIECSFNAHHTQLLQELFKSPVIISDNATFQGYFNDIEQQWEFNTFVPNIRYGSALMHEVSLHIDNKTQQAQMELDMELDSMWMGLDAQLNPDSLALQLVYDALPPNVSHGRVAIESRLMHYAGLPYIEAHILPSTIQLGDSSYHISDSRVAYSVADTALVVSQFCFRGHNQSIMIDGVGSSHSTDTMQIDIRNIDLGVIMPFLLPARTLTVKGFVSGWGHIYSLFKSPMFEADVTVDSTLFNECYWGRVHADVGLNRELEQIIINGAVHDGERQTADVQGVVEPQKSHFEIDVQPDSLPLGFIGHWTQGFLTDLEGRGSGTVKIIGEGRKTYVLTRVKAHNVGLTVPFTGCRYFVNDSIFMDSTSIIFPNLAMWDSEGNDLFFNGIIHHDEYFRNFELDLHAVCNNTLAFNLPPSSQSIQGKVYATGSMDLTGKDTDLKLVANAICVGRSQFRLSLGGVSSAKDNSFIEFVDRKQDVVVAPMDELRIIPTHKRPRFTKISSRFRMELGIDIDPQTLFELVINERTGDMIKARGDGSIKFSLDDATNEMKLVGTYTIADGKMGFTVGNLIRRDFTIAPGSQIIWNGKAEEPTLQVTARYQVVASLKDLFGTETEGIVSGRTTIPVTTLIYMSGTLEDPIIRFGIELPKSEENIENQVKAIINTDEMMMRQVVNLLVFGKFFTPEYVSSSQSSALNNTYSLLSSTITGQINNWLGRLTNVFTLGFNMRSEGVDEQAAREYEAVFQLQPVDRLIINGNFGYRYNDISNRPFFGDLDIECLLTPNGKYRLHGYTHTVDKYSLRQASTIQGIGLLFRHDFNWRLTDEEKKLRAAQRETKKSAKKNR